MAAVRSAACPAWSPKQRGQVLGYAYAAPVPRRAAAYRYTVEDTRLCRPRRAAAAASARAVLSAVIAACEALGLRQMVAVIGDRDNAGSIAPAPRAAASTHAGVTPGVGFKHGRWVDIVWMQKALNGGLDATPHGPGLAL